MVYNVKAYMTLAVANVGEAPTAYKPCYMKACKEGNMKAYIKDLKGKYYGTEVVVYNDSSAVESTIKIWTGLDYEPSERELKICRDCNSEYKYGNPCRECFSDSHHESRMDYELSKVICEAINTHAFI